MYSSFLYSTSAFGSFFFHIFICSLYFFLVLFSVIFLITDFLSRLLCLTLLLLTFFFFNLFLHPYYYSLHKLSFSVTIFIKLYHNCSSNIYSIFLTLAFPLSLPPFLSTHFSPTHNFSPFIHSSPNLFYLVVTPFSRSVTPLITLFSLNPSVHCIIFLSTLLQFFPPVPRSLLPFPVPSEEYEVNSARKGF